MGKIDSVSGQILGNIPENVGELHGDAHFDGAMRSFGGVEAENAAHDETHNGGDVIAIELQLGKILDFDVHLVPAAALDQVQIELPGNFVLAGGFGKGGSKGERTLAGFDFFQFFLQEGKELLADFFFRWGFVQKIIDIAAEGVDGEGALTAVPGQGEGAEIEAFGMPPGNFLAKIQRWPQILAATPTGAGIWLGPGGWDFGPDGGA